jgi:DNA invertase Pin-like site-specific DNA recombinase
MKKACAVYIRDCNYGPTASDQKSKGQSAAVELGCDTQIYFEDTESTTEHSSFDKMMDLINSGSVSVMIIESLDRIGGFVDSIEKLMAFVASLHASGTRFLSLEEKLDSTSEAGIFIDRALRGLKKSRRIIQGERIHLALSNSKKEGQPVGRPRQVDYQQILNLRRNGLSIQKIADQLKISRGAVQNCLSQSDINAST